jgi:hypothetical protein
MDYKLKRKVVEENGTDDYGFTMKVPPVSPSVWDTDDWIKWIENTGGFYIKRKTFKC